MPFEAILWKTRIHLPRKHHLSLESRTSQLRSATHVYCPAIHRIERVRASFYRSTGYSSLSGLHNASRSIQAIAECRPHALGEVAPRWAIHSVDKRGQGGRPHLLWRLSDRD